ncbi:DUF7096 domain-containing protein [Haladaptatus sp. NG-WS-4]
MSRVLPVVLAVLLILCSPTAAFKAGAETSVSPTTDAENPAKPPGVNNTTSELSPGKTPQAATHKPSINLGVALEMDRTEVREQKRMYALDEQLSNTASRAEKEQVLIRYQFELKSELASLKNRERTISRQYSNGKLSTSAYAARLAVLDARAENIEQSIEYMDTQAESVPRFSPEKESLKADIVPISGPVRQMLRDTYRNEITPRSVYVSATERGVVLAAIRDSQFVREAYRADYRNPDKSGQMTLQKAQNHTYMQYPLLSSFDNREVHAGTDQLISTGVLVSRFVHPQGVIEAYLDSGTKKIFREIQYKDLTGKHHVPYGDPVRNNTTSLEIIVNRTYPGGPLRINVTDADGNPVKSHVLVGGDAVGDTGPDGVLWTVAPHRRFTVSSTHESETVNVTLDPYGTAQTNATSGTPES